MPVWDEEVDHFTPPVSTYEEFTYEIKMKPVQREPDEDVMMGRQETAPVMRPKPFANTVEMKVNKKKEIFDSLSSILTPRTFHIFSLYCITFRISIILAGTRSSCADQNERRTSSSIGRRTKTGRYRVIYTLTHFILHVLLLIRPIDSHW